MRFLPYIFVSGGIFLACCQRGSTESKTTKPLYDSVPVVVPVQPMISEASGIADSKKNPGYLWVLEDGGNPSDIYLLKHDGRVEKKIAIKGVTNRDWEDMVLAGNDLYLGEIGDNNSMYAEYAIYKFPEPPKNTDSVTGVETIRFRYPDGSHDAEAFLVDPANGSIYIITKRGSASRFYKLMPPFSSAVQTAVAAGQLSYGGVVSAAISSDRKEIIIKTYFELGHYKINNGESIEAALSRPPASIPYQAEPQGEAVCFSASNNGYFTLSEKSFAPDVRLYFYKRN